MNRNSYPVYLVAKTIRLALLPFAKMKYGKKHIWIVSERGTDARDNGYHMFRYLRREHPEINAWYVISPDSKDLDKVADLGNIVYKGTLKHWMLYITAEKFLVAFEPLVPSANKRFEQEVIRKNDMKIIFLQHGITGNDIPCYHRDVAKYDMYICGAKPEYDFIKANFSYKNGEERYTGLARFDALQDNKTKRQILIMPSWRRYVRDLSVEEAADSEYVKMWNSLLHSTRLSQIAEKYDASVIFYPHQLMQKFIGLFSAEGSRITIADYGHYDVQPLLLESAFLITDFSSVHFDFAYMGKPLAYYQFDEERIFTEHTPRGYFDYNEMGFGPKVNSEDELLDFVEECTANDFRQTPEYEKRTEGFFPLHDTKNCERIYKEITETFDRQ